MFHTPHPGNKKQLQEDDLMSDVTLSSSTSRVLAQPSQFPPPLPTLSAAAANNSSFQNSEYDDSDAETDTNIRSVNSISSTGTPAPTPRISTTFEDTNDNDTFPAPPRTSILLERVHDALQALQEWSRRGSDMLQEGSARASLAVQTGSTRASLIFHDGSARASRFLQDGIASTSSSSLSLSTSRASLSIQTATVRAHEWTGHATTRAKDWTGQAVQKTAASATSMVQATRRSITSIGSSPLIMDDVNDNDEDDLDLDDSNESLRLFRVKGQSTDRWITSVPYEVVAAVSILGFVSGLVSFLVISSSQVTTVASLCVMLLAPLVFLQKQGRGQRLGGGNTLLDLAVVRGQHTACRRKILCLLQQKGQLGQCIQALETHVKSLDSIPRQLETLAQQQQLKSEEDAAAPVDLDDLVQIVHETRDNQAHIKAALLASFLQDVLTMIVVADRHGGSSQNCTISQQDVQRLVLQLQTSMPGVCFRADRFQSLVAMSNNSNSNVETATSTTSTATTLNLATVCALVRNLQDESLPSEQRILQFDESKVSQIAKQQQQQQQQQQLYPEKENEGQHAHREQEPKNDSQQQHGCDKDGDQWEPITNAPVD